MTELQDRPGFGANVVPLADFRGADSDRSRGAATAARPIADVDTEAGLIGCILIQPDVFPLIQHLVTAEQFFEPVHQVIWEAVTNVVAAGDTPNLLKVKRALGERITEQDLGGKSVMEYLVGLTGVPAVPASAVEYARTVQQLWQIRAIGETAGQAANGSGFVVGPFLDGLYARIDQVRASFVDRKVRSASLAQAGDALMARIQASLNGEAAELPRSGIVALDEELGGGLAPSSLITGGARTSMGKSVWGVEVSRHVAHDGAAAIYHSLEMPSEQVVARLASSRLLDLGREIPFSRIMKRRGVTSDDAHAVAGALHDVRNYPLTIEDGGGRTIGDIAAASDRLANAYARKGIPLGVIVIDHAHIVKPSRAFKREDEGFKEVADGALALAKHLDTCVLLLAQLNRGTEGRDDKRPSLADLRGPARSRRTRTQ
ncbi:replicative DNA helicase [Methylobacterium oxalidis]|uniref:DNA 5'-3' helicase n=1 Tax=Methylobacterium oxalidis TaxID=944322 RepID=A0A512JA56_9HYPH|nr:DnaB-like helicase C-terminal domain-containing protein [Methylobacterium oxalidis]GEP06842.1 replicative DNA helicase [Methylobacterium oxalidis]GJE35023.1 Replicative DNA helicase [Methylobacterium oxalidis]GLS67560.1 replicative DNA helicase [Methylobacterium oxalidis]